MSKFPSKAGDNPDDPNDNFQAQVVREQRAKAKATGSIPTRQDIQNRLKDEMQGIRQGTAHVDMNPSGMHPDAPEPVPSIEDLGLSLVNRKHIQNKVSAFPEVAGEVLDLIEGHELGHVELGLIERKAKKRREQVTGSLKILLADHVGDEAPKFYSGPNLVNRFTSKRTSFDKNVARDALLALGVPSAKIAKAWQAATLVTPTETLKITPPGENDNE